MKGELIKYSTNYSDNVKNLEKEKIEISTILNMDDTPLNGPFEKGKSYKVGYTNLSNGYRYFSSYICNALTKYFIYLATATVSIKIDLEDFKKKYSTEPISLKGILGFTNGKAVDVIVEDIRDGVTGKYVNNRSDLKLYCNLYNFKLIRTEGNIRKISYEKGYFNIYASGYKIHLKEGSLYLEYESLYPEKREKKNKLIDKINNL